MLKLALSLMTRGSAPTASHRILIGLCLVAITIVLTLAANPSRAQSTSTSALRITPPDPPNKGILFVDHSKSNRSGHLGHALVEYEDGKILAFYPNCSDDHDGHSAVGWMEFKRSEDGGKTWSARKPLPFSKKLFKKGEGRTAMAEKAVVTDQNEIVLFYLICDVSKTPLWQPYWKPLYTKSADGGRTWSEPKPVCKTRGRIYDAIYQDGEIMSLHFANDATVTWWGSTDEHIYEFHVSSDGGKTFSRRSVLPFNTKDRGYGSLGRLKNGDLIAFVYNRKNEHDLDYVTSSDGGRTWSKVGPSHLSRKIRNPQFIAFGGRFFMHGRSGAYGEGSGHMILYTSADGLNWDDGTYLRIREAGTGAYSNSIVVGTKNDNTPNRLLIQASHAYKGSRTNVLHWWIDGSNSIVSEP
ncbi:MAG: exo-alpha-sialidase [Pirellulales bacterium]|nr:exo-alpha-sialidase [Pirellulales bacterium]